MVFKACLQAWERAWAKVFFVSFGSMFWGLCVFLVSVPKKTMFELFFLCARFQISLLLIALPASVGRHMSFVCFFWLLLWLVLRFSFLSQNHQKYSRGHRFFKIRQILNLSRNLWFFYYEYFCAKIRIALQGGTKALPASMGMLSAQYGFFVFEILFFVFVKLKKKQKTRTKAFEKKVHANGDGVFL